jgi:hypothetical protein
MNSAIAMNAKIFISIFFIELTTTPQYSKISFIIFMNFIIWIQLHSFQLVGLSKS